MELAICPDCQATWDLDSTSGEIVVTAQEAARAFPTGRLPDMTQAWCPRCASK
jgi:hypothetical protein